MKAISLAESMTDPDEDTFHEDRNSRSATEATPLLANSDEIPVGNKQPNGSLSNDDATGTTVQRAGEDENEDEDKLPVKQILLLCYARLFEPIAFFTIFPFVNQMIFDTGEVDEADVGFYSGLIESLFSLTQMCAMLPWGRLADNPRVGRKPPLYFSIVGVSICMALFGMSKSIWQMIATRCAAGIFAGTVVTIRTMISENSTPKTQARAFSWFAFSGNLGIFIGPVIGGALADPAHQFRGLFGRSKFFIEYPYALPMLFVAAFGLSAALLSFFFVEETLKPKNRSPGTDGADKKTSTWELLTSEGVAFVLFLYGFIMILAFSYTAVMPVFLFTPIRLGGFGFTPLWISIYMAVGGLAQSIWLLVIFPLLQKRFGTGGVLRLCAIAYPFFFAGGPAASLLLRHNLNILFDVLVPIGLVLGSGVAMSFTAVQLSLNDINPRGSETLGTLNALALAFVSGIRAFSPALFTSIFAIGVRKQILGGYLVWLVMFVLTFGFIILMRFLPPKAEGRVVKESAAEASEA